jgi:hypothetical protein
MFCSSLAGFMQKKKFVQEQRSMPKAQHQAVEAAQQHAGATTDVDRVQ